MSLFYYFLYIFLNLVLVYNRDVSIFMFIMELILIDKEDGICLYFC